MQKSLITLIDKIVGKQQERAQAREADYLAIVQQIAAGKEPDADRVDALLREAGKTLENLTEDVERLQQRHRLREQVDELPRLAAERQQVEKQIAAADEALADAEQTHAEVTAPLAARVVELREAMWAAEAAKRQLAEGCTDPVLLAHKRDIESQLDRLRRDSVNLRNAISDSRDRARNEQALAEQAQRIVHGEQQAKEHQDLAKRHERTVAGYEAELAKVEKAIAALERREQAVRDQMLAP